MAYVEQEECNNPYMRFYGTLSLNGRVVGKGFGSNKKQVKFVASRLALQNIAPTLYKEWKATLKTSTLPESLASRSDSGEDVLDDFEMVPITSAHCQPQQMTAIQSDTEMMEQVEMQKTQPCDKENMPPALRHLTPQKNPVEESKTST